MLTTHGTDSRRDEQGVVAVVTALCTVSLLVITAMVVDFGMARMNRQMNKSAADSAVMAGLRGADGGTTEVYTHRGVCTALAYLRANEPGLVNLPPGGCDATVATTSPITCNPSNPGASLMEYFEQVVENGVTYSVRIKSPVEVSEFDVYDDESYATLASDTSQMSGCDQLMVVVEQSRPTIFGGIASGDDAIETTVRSVGRVAVGDGDLAPALLLLERTKCNVLSVGSAGAGAGSYIRVYGSGMMPGSIHADTDASDSSSCGTTSGKQVFQGKQANGLVAYGAPTGGASGLITSVAASSGVAAGIVSDGIANVYGTTGVDENSAGTTSSPTGRGLVTRRPVDNRYIAGVRSDVGAASAVWTAPSSGYTRTIGCSPNATAIAEVGLLNSSDSLYIDCPGGYDYGTEAAPLMVGAGTVFINGFFKSGGLLMPNATRVYVKEKAPGAGGAGIKLANANGFCVGWASCTSSPVAQCPLTETSVRRQVFVRTGTLTQTGGILRACNTTVYLLGGNDNGCVPSTSGTAPTSTPCSGAGGTGQLKINGGVTDWTAPNQYAGAIPEPDQVGAWEDGEDLALWAESASGYSMAGGGAMQLVGVLMAPNASPFELSGGGSQALKNAQYIARSFALAGGATLSMTVDPNSAVTVPELDPFTLVR